MAARDAYFPLVITFIVIDSIAVALRFKVRSSKDAVGYDDFAMLLSFVRLRSPNSLPSQLADMTKRLVFHPRVTTRIYA